MSSPYSLLPYTPDLAERWDRFVEEESGNGTLFHTRRFLSYHPEGRFDDASVLVFAGERLAAVVPTARIGAGNFFSHPGTSAGGPVIGREFWSSERLFPLLETLWNHYGPRWEMRIGEQHLSSEPLDPLIWFFGHRLREVSELSSAIRLEGGDPLNKISRPKNSAAIRNLGERGITLSCASSEEEYLRFHQLLTRNLEKHSVRPVHSPEELRTLAVLLGEKQQLRIARNGEGEMVAGCWILRATPACLHLQYSARVPEAPGATVAALLVRAMEEGKQQGASLFSFGISTEERGAVLNSGLYTFKERLGGRPALRRLFLSPSLREEER